MNNNPWAAYQYARPPGSFPMEQRGYQHGPDDLLPEQHENYYQPPPYEVVSSQGPQSTPMMDSEKPYDNTLYPDSPTMHTKPAHGRSRSSSNASSEIVLQHVRDIAQQPAQPPTSSRRLQRPVAIPQAMAGLGMPFARCFSHDLEGHGVQMGELLRFIDNLNVVSAGSPPLQIVDLAGGVVGMVPFQHAQLISFGIQSVAKIGKVAVSKTRGTMFLSKSNTEFFNPRGLSVKLVTTDALLAKLNIDSNVLSVNSQGVDNLGMLERRVAVLNGYIAPVTFNVPPPDPQKNIINKMSAAQQKQVMAKQEKKFQKERAKHGVRTEGSQTSAGQANPRQDMRNQAMNNEIQAERSQMQKKVDKINRELDNKLAKKPQDAPKIEAERAKETAKVEKEMRKKLKKRQDSSDSSSDSDAKKSKKDGKRKSKEAKAFNKIQWILIESLPANPDGLPACTSV